jgi:diguanylate cyclase (GGDEF)-like protein
VRFSPARGGGDEDQRADGRAAAAADVVGMEAFVTAALVTGDARHTSGSRPGPSIQPAVEQSSRVAQLTERIEYQALHDLLTGLPNRRLFRDRAEQALRGAVRNGSGCAVILLDLDRFSEVNDTLGHQAGDKLLVEIGARLRLAVRQVDTVARVGGDAFGILAPGISDPAAARVVAAKLCNELIRPFVIDGLELECEASVGIALFPENGADVETLIRRAGIAGHLSKNTHTPVVFAGSYDRTSSTHLALMPDLRRAIEVGELVVDYQPETDVATGEVRKVEALVRWKHPKHGLLGPDQFIPIAEQTGLIRKLTRYVLDVALAQCAEWQATGVQLAVAVNITGRELVDLDFPREVAELLSKWAIDPSNLELEVSERTIMTDSLRALAVLAQLSDLGVRIAIDDFGTGHASLASLRQLPIDVIKIDRSFVQSMAESQADAALVRMAIDTGHNLGLEVVAEGVETESTLRRLEALGCDTLQGFLLGRPQAASLIPAQLRGHSRRGFLATPSPVAACGGVG